MLCRKSCKACLTLATFGLLFGLMLFATYNDILRLITGSSIRKGEPLCGRKNAK